MTGRAMPGTRERILTEARELFIERGYPRTSISLLADRLGLSKAAVLYHFPSKEQLLVALAEPLLLELRTVVDAAERLPPERARWTLIERWLDAVVAHRRSLRLFGRDLALLSSAEIYQQFLSVAHRAQALVAGPRAGLVERVRAVQAVGMLGDPMVYMTEVPESELVPAVLDGVRRLLVPESLPDGAGPAGGAPVRARPGAGGRQDVVPVRAVRPAVRGRPAVMTPGRRAGAERLLASGEHTPAEIARVLGVSRATFYRYLASRPADVSENDYETPVDDCERL